MVPPDSERLLNLAAEKIRDGALPGRHSGNLFAGPGQDQPCSLCDGAIGAHQVEYEITGMSAGAARALRFHLACYRAWMQACLR